jgi:hypothetical protein
MKVIGKGMKEQQSKSRIEQEIQTAPNIEPSVIAPTIAPKPPPEVLMKQYEILVETHKHHLDLVLKLNIFSYAVTGGILSFYFTQKYGTVINFALALPFIMNAAFSVFCFYASGSLKTTADELERIKNDFSLIAYPDVRFLKYALRLSGGLFAIVALGLFIIAVIRLAAS